MYRVARRIGVIANTPLFQIDQCGDIAPAKRVGVADGLPLFARLRGAATANTLLLGRRIGVADNKPLFIAESGCGGETPPSIQTACCDNGVPLVLHMTNDGGAFWAIADLQWSGIAWLATTSGPQDRTNFWSFECTPNQGWVLRFKQTTSSGFVISELTFTAISTACNPISVTFSFVGAFTITVAS